MGTLILLSRLLTFTSKMVRSRRHFLKMRASKNSGTAASSKNGSQTRLEAVELNKHEVPRHLTALSAKERSSDKGNRWWGAGSSQWGVLSKQWQLEDGAFEC